VAIVALIFSVRYGKEALDTYRDGAILDESIIFETEQQTRGIIDIATEKGYKSLDEIQEIHAEAANLQKMIDDMLNNLLASINQEGSSLEELRKLDYAGAGRDVIVKSGWGRDFITRAREFENNLIEIVDDPVTRYQIQDHLAFTGDIWFMEFGPDEIIYDPVIKIYYKNTYVSKGIALAEYVAIKSLMEAK
jgi:CRISPR/Cas system CMR subunit Cmr4 (Cas7 group RAMP superfamily)